MTITINGTVVDPESLSQEMILKISPYGYLPTGWVCYTFVVLFGLSTGLHFIQALWKRAYWLLFTVTLCGIGECAAWAGRLWSFHNILNKDAYMMQICAAIIAPTPLLAVNFVMLGRIITLLGPHYGLLPPKYYSALFITADVTALVIQGVGGGFASTSDDPTGGGHIMLAGIGFQFALMIIYSILAIDFFWRWKNEKPYRRATNSALAPSSATELLSTSEIKMKLGAEDHTYAHSQQFVALVAALGFTTLCLFIRAVYRLIELSDGWTGEIMLTEKWFVAFDGLMVLLVMFVFNIIHPAVFFPAQPPRQTSKV